MIMEKLKEWFIDGPWGKIALASWGNPNGEPVLLVHGREDSLDTFIPLLGHLPDTLHYVGVDLPGHGLSDPIPIGVTLMRLHLLVGVEYAVKHLGWETFTFIGHSMGCEMGLFYNAIHPGRIKQFVLLDPITSLQRLFVDDHSDYFSTFYSSYYNNYSSNPARVYSKKRAIDAVARARGLSKEQAELLLRRNLKRVGEDLYQLSWDRRLKQPAPSNFGFDYYRTLFSCSRPTLLIHAADAPIVHPGRTQRARDLANELWGPGDSTHVLVSGPHDVHVTDPGLVGEKIRAFLSRGKAKL